MAEAVPFGVWLVDKPAGPTSHAVCAAIRRRLGRGVRVGHAGTLDPFATGLLVVLVGRATRLAQFVTGLDKTYVAGIRLGVRSATGDPEGPLTPSEAPLPAPEDVAAAVAGMEGPQRQRVPALAAVKVDGERLYRRTRRGERVETPERDIVIHRARVRRVDGPDVEVELRCSSGTYVRQFAADLGERLGCGAYCRSLRRTAVGTLDVADAVSPDAVLPHGGVDPRRALAPMPERPLSDAELMEATHGRDLAGPAEGPVMLVAHGELVAVARPTPDGTLHPQVVLR